MKAHRDFSTSAFSLPAVAPSVGPFASAGFLGLASPPALLVESEDALVAVEEGGAAIGGAGHRDIVDYRTPRGPGAGDLIARYAMEKKRGTEFAFDSLPVEAADVVASGLVRGGVDVEVTGGESTAVVQLPRSWDDYLADIGKKQRHELRRKRRRYEDLVGGVVHEIHRGEGWALGEFIRLHRLAGGDKGEVMGPEMTALFTALAGLEGWRIDVLRIPGTDSASACLFSYVDDDGFYLYNSSYEPSLGDASPGMVLIGACIQQAIEISVSRFDFLKGDETYKYRLGAEPRTLMEVSGRR